MRKAIAIRPLILLFLLILPLGLSSSGDPPLPAQIIPDLPRDSIPPLDHPKYDEVAQVNWLSDSDWVIGFARQGDARAYPIAIMNWHEIVNDTIGGLEVLISYCPLCHSGIVFDRRLSQAELPGEAPGGLDADTVLAFGNTGSLYESDLVMYDRQTESQWFQVGGEAITGPLQGTRLRRLPALMLSWGRWKQLYPQGLVLSRETGYRRPYGSDPYQNYNRRASKPGFPISRLDPRTEPKARVLGLSLAGLSRAYQLDRLADGVYADRLGAQPLALFVEQGAGVAYSPLVEGNLLTFVLSDGEIRDRQTGSLWDMSGRAISGKLAGRELKPLPQTNAFWFSWALAAPQTELVTDPSGFSPYSSSSLTPWWWGEWLWMVLLFIASTALWLALRRSRGRRSSGQSQA